MATGEPQYPYTGFNFRIEIDGLTLASFSEAAGLDAEGDAIEYREGTDRVNWSRKLPGLRKYPNITLKRGITQNKELWAWYRNIANGVPDRRDGTIVLMNEARADVLRWNFRSAWPNKVTGPALNATGNEVVVESVELCHEGLDIEV